MFSLGGRVFQWIRHAKSFLPNNLFPVLPLKRNKTDSLVHKDFCTSACNLQRYYLSMACALTAKIIKSTNHVRPLVKKYMASGSSLYGQVRKVIKDDHRWIESQPVQQGQAESRSMCGRSHSTEFDPTMKSSRSVERISLSTQPKMHLWPA